MDVSGDYNLKIEKSQCFFLALFKGKINFDLYTKQFKQFESLRFTIIKTDFGFDGYSYSAANNLLTLLVA